MKMSKICLLSVVASLVGCSELFPRDSLNVELIEFTTRSGRPAVTLKATNTGDYDLYNVYCDALAMSGSTAIDDAFLYFAYGATIKPGKSAQETGVWFNLSSHDQYQTIDWQCDYLVGD